MERGWFCWCTDKGRLKCKAYFVICALLAFAFISGHPGAPVRFPSVQDVVWHHEQTIGILRFEGGRRHLLVYCNLIIIEKVEKEYKQKVLEDLAKKYPIQEVDFKTMLGIVGACNDLQRGRDPPFKSYPIRPILRNHTKPLSLLTMLKGIVPGTKWCGVNDIANNYHDLGEDFELDKCCRAHDHCPVKIKSFSENYGVRNNHPYTKSHCECDDLFFQCLKKSREDKAHAIGNVFFNVLGLQCAEPIYPKVCLSRESGSLDEVQRNAEVQGSNSNLPLEKRFLLNWFQTPQERHQPRCLKWVDDPDGPLQFRFRSPRRQF